MASEAWYNADNAADKIAVHLSHQGAQGITSPPAYQYCPASLQAQQHRIWSLQVILNMGLSWLQVLLFR